jgi:hypothetical protein
MRKGEGLFLIGTLVTPVALARICSFLNLNKPFLSIYS